MFNAIFCKRLVTDMRPERFYNIEKEWIKLYNIIPTCEQITAQMNKEGL